MNQEPEQSSLTDLYRGMQARACQDPTHERLAFDVGTAAIGAEWSKTPRHIANEAEVRARAMHILGLK